MTFRIALEGFSVTETTGEEAGEARNPADRLSMITLRKRRRRPMVQYFLRKVAFVAMCLCVLIAFSALAWAQTPHSCMGVAVNLNRKLSAKIDPKELTEILDSLNASNNTSLPAKFITKREAKRMGWKPGQDLWSVRELRGKSIGGDIFSNREGQLPDGERVWHEADLDYKGKHRGAKRIIYSDDGLRVITVNHYKSFMEAPPCK